MCKFNQVGPGTTMNSRSKGDKGEEIASKFLESKGFLVVDRNYQKKWGELDIVAIKDKIPHFFEVKSVVGDYSGISDSHQPEENIHSLKIRNLRRMVDTYLAEKGMLRESEFYFHILCVYMDEVKKRARVKWIENVVL